MDREDGAAGSKADLPAKAVFRLVQAKVPRPAGWVAAMAIKRFLSHLAVSGWRLRSRGGAQTVVGVATHWRHEIEHLIDSCLGASSIV